MDASPISAKQKRVNCITASELIPRAESSSSPNTYHIIAVLSAALVSAKATSSHAWAL
jgi:hypothetical protein